MRISVSPRSCRERPSRFKGYSCSEMSSKARVLFSVVSIFAGTYACLSPALAEVEEGASQDGGKPAGITTLSDDTETNLFIDNSVDDGLGTGGSPDLAPVINPNKFDLIPETVWNLDVSTGVHLDHTSVDPGSEFYTIPGGRLEIEDFWIRAIFGSRSWSSRNTYDGPDLLIAPPQFQVASCGGSSPEHSNLDHCNHAQIVADQLGNPSQKLGPSDSDTEVQGDNNNVLSSSDATASNSSAQTNIAPFPPAIADIEPPVQETLSVLGWNDSFVSWVTTQIAAPETPFDSTASSSDDLAPPTDPPYSEILIPGPITYVGDPGSGPSLPPVITPEPLKPIPEASTWVMTVIGFSIMTFVFGRKKRNRINPISVIDVLDVR